MGCRYWYQVNAIPQVDGTGSPEKTKKPGHRPEEGRNGVMKETKKPTSLHRKNADRAVEVIISLALSAFIN